MGAIRAYEAQIAQAKHDLAHITATIKILEGSDAERSARMCAAIHTRNGMVAMLGAAADMIELLAENAGRV